MMKTILAEILTYFILLRFSFLYIFIIDLFILILGGLVVAGCCICLYLRVKLYMNHGEALVMKLK